MWNLKQGWKNIFAFNCLSLCSEVSPFAAEAGLRVIASFLFHKVGSPPAPPEPALRIVSSFFFFWLHWMNCLPEITNLLLQHLAEFG